MGRACLSRRLLRAMSFKVIRAVNEHFELPPRKSKEDMVAQIVYKVGQDLQNLVCADGPFSLADWNKILEEIQGAPRKSFEDAAEEFKLSLDPVFDEFDGDLRINELRTNNSDVRLLAKKLGVEKDELAERINAAHGSVLLSKFVSEYRDIQSTLAESMPAASGVFCVASTRVAAEGVEKLEMRWMKMHLAGADQVDIAAGFYDHDFLDDLLSKKKPVKKVRLLFNGLGGYRLHKQRDDLRDFEKKLQKYGVDAEIKLSFAPGMFHTKLFLIKKEQETNALVGSANATKAAFERNEEVLVSLHDAGALVNYFDSAWGKATGLDVLDVKAKNLIAFFRTGLLYFKPTATLSTSFNPFAELLKNLSDDQKKMLGAIKLQYAELETGVGPFSLRLAINGQPDGGSEYLEYVDESDEDVERNARASIKPWSVETCFGYWVPSALDNQWREKLMKAGENKQTRWENFKKELLATSSDVLADKYQEYLKDFRAKLGTLPGSEKLLADLKSDPFDPNIFGKFVNKIKYHLEDDERIERLSQPFVKAVMPEIWDDQLAYSEFRESFSDYLYRISRTKGNSRVPSAILKKLISAKFEDGEELLKELEGYLKKNGWTDDDWEKPHKKS